MTEEKKTEETPTLAEEKPKKEEKKESPTTDVDGLIAELEKAGVSNVEQLEGKLIASSQAGNLANQLGTARDEIAALGAALKESNERTRSEQPLVEEETDLSGMIKRDVRAAMKEEREEENKVYRQAQQTSLAMWNAIQNDPNYHLVKDVWEAKIADPNFTVKTQQGLHNPYKEYTDTVLDYYKGIAKRSVETIKTLTGKSDVTVPHVEGEGQVAPPPSESEKSAQEEKLTRYKEKVDKGGRLTEEEELDALVANLTK